MALLLFRNGDSPVRSADDDDSRCHRSRSRAPCRGAPARPATLRRADPAPARDRHSRADPARPRRRAHLLCPTARGGQAAGRLRTRRAAIGTRPGALCPDLCGTVARGRGDLANCPAADDARGNPRHGGALPRSDGRAAGQGSLLLPEQLCRLADQARPRVRAAVRGHLRRAVLLGDVQSAVAWIRRCRALVVFAAPDRRAAGHDGCHVRERPAA